jgi:hypothetical protein
MTCKGIHLGGQSRYFGNAFGGITGQASGPSWSEYASMAFSVQQRTQEIGIRMAMDASSQEVRRMVVRQGMILALTEVIIGVAAALTSLLYGVTPRDPMAMTFGGGVAHRRCASGHVPSGAARIKGRSGNLASI